MTPTIITGTGDTVPVDVPAHTRATPAYLRFQWPTLVFAEVGIETLVLELHKFNPITGTSLVFSKTFPVADVVAPVGVAPYLPVNLTSAETNYPFPFPGMEQHIYRGVLMGVGTNVLVKLAGFNWPLYEAGYSGLVGPVPTPPVMASRAWVLEQIALGGGGGGSGDSAVRAASYTLAADSDTLAVTLLAGEKVLAVSPQAYCPVTYQYTTYVGSVATLQFSGAHTASIPLALTIQRP